jgi:hypothetical protein
MPEALASYLSTAWRDYQSERDAYRKACNINRHCNNPIVHSEEAFISLANAWNAYLWALHDWQTYWEQQPC